MTQRPELSVVLPIFNEAEVLRDCLAEVSGQLERTGQSFELICVDDGSTDGSGPLLEELTKVDGRLALVRLSRNFGKEAALSAGLSAARGDAVLLMDADLQHPPDLIPTMVARWREGYDVVDAVKQDRGGEKAAYRLFALTFYELMGRAVGRNLQGASDFKLLDRQVVDALLTCPERNRFFRGLVAWVGFRVARVPFEVQARRGGRTKWTRRGLVAYSVRNLVAFSSVPLRLVAWMGFVTVGAGALLALQTLFNYLEGVAISGFTTVILLMIILCGLILVSLGVIAFYLAMIYEEQKARPLFVIRRERREGEPADGPRGHDPGPEPEPRATASGGGRQNIT